MTIYREDGSIEVQTKNKANPAPWNEPTQADNCHWYIRDSNDHLIAGFVNKADAYLAWSSVNGVKP